MAATFRQIAEKIRAEYTLGFYPVDPTTGAMRTPIISSADSRGAMGILAKAGWHSLRIDVVDQSNARVSHRAAYYMPAIP